jgi:hypothetical protein
LTISLIPAAWEAGRRIECLRPTHPKKKAVRPYLKNKIKRAERITQCLPSMPRALDLTLSTTKVKKTFSVEHLKHSQK